MVDYPDLLARSDEERVFSELEELEAPKGELHLRFYLPSGKVLALPATGIREVVALSPNLITSIPNASLLLLGTINLRGQVIWVADLGQFLGDEGVLNTERQEIPVIAIDEQDTLLGLAVEGIVGTDWLDFEQIQMPANVPDSMAPFVRGEWRLNPESNQSLWLLDQGAVLHSTRWTV